LRSWAEGAVNIVFKKEIENAEDKVKPELV